MQAVVFAGTREVAVQDVPDADLEEPTDVLLRVTSSAICGTDLHMYDGRAGATPGLVLGDSLEDDLVLLADAWVTGWHASVLAQMYASAAPMTGGTRCCSAT